MIETKSITETSSETINTDTGEREVVHVTEMHSGITVTTARYYDAEDRTPHMVVTETAEEAEELPTVLAQYLETTGQLDRGPLSESHLLNEAEWVMYKSGQDGSVAHGANQSQKEALRRYVGRLRARGVTPRRDFYD